jgi:hypothetical protein
MSYGNSIRAFIEDGPVEQVAKVDAGRSTARAWRALDAAHRLEVIERAQSPANDCIDEYPLAL